MNMSRCRSATGYVEGFLGGVLSIRGQVIRLGDTHKRVHDLLEEPESEFTFMDAYSWGNVQLLVDYEADQVERLNLSRIPPKR